MTPPAAVDDAIALPAGEVNVPAVPKPRAEVLAIVSILLGAAGQLVLKSALLLLAAHHADSRTFVRLVEPASGVLLGLGIYGVGTLFWIKAVSRAAISYLYPLTAISYALVALGGRFLLGENIQFGRWAGIAVITIGVAMLAASNLRGAEA